MSQQSPTITHDAAPTDAPAPPVAVPESPAPAGAGETTEKFPSDPEGANVEDEEAVSDPVDPERRALDELKQLVATALANSEFTPRPTPATVETTLTDEEKKETKDEAVEESGDAPKVAPLEAAEAGAPAPPPPEEPPQPETASEPDHEDESKTFESIETVPTDAHAIGEIEKEAPLATEEGETASPESAPQKPEEVFIWGVPLLVDERSDAVLLKFLRAREFKAKDALEMIKSTVLWRKQFGIEGLIEEYLGLPEFERIVFTHGVDREGHKVCYNVYGEFQNLELYEKAFGDAEKRERFLKWRIQYLEKEIRESLDFGPGGICSMVQVTDLKNSPWRGKHKQVMNQAVTLLQDNYPEFIAKKVFINVPWWNLAYYRMMSSVFSPRTKSKFVFAGPSKSAETLFKYIAPEQVPVAFGGLSKENDPDFTTADSVIEVTIKPASKQSIEIPATESSLLTWELRVLGWEVKYGAEFVPNDGYTVIVQKSRKILASDEPIIKACFNIGEPGKVVLNFENPTSKKKKLLYRFKVMTSTEST